MAEEVGVVGVVVGCVVAVADAVGCGCYWSRYCSFDSGCCAAGAGGCFDELTVCAAVVVAAVVGAGVNFIGFAWFCDWSFCCHFGSLLYCFFSGNEIARYGL